ncbi:MAG: hypothetical protein H7A21_01335 [Spirochaetales bacterium]|nr:hypothetical protein [Leptospiraceae bacterium]MCP5480052.1 hypothetical protein [Spirochaetales bacterium]MCP5485607.1 hypothetical protein [Spirochaetales bacterium]
MSSRRIRLIEALRETATRLANGADYRWTHMGSCNCGHLAQTITPHTRAEIHAFALARPGDWAEQARDLDIEYCKNSGLAIDSVFEAMFELGLTPLDISHLERLSDPLVLACFPTAERFLDHRRREDVVRYMRAWAQLLENQSEPEFFCEGTASKLREQAALLARA